MQPESGPEILPPVNRRQFVRQVMIAAAALGAAASHVQAAGVGPVAVRSAE